MPPKIVDNPPPATEPDAVTITPLREGLVDALKTEFTVLSEADKIDVNFLFGKEDGKARFRVNAWEKEGWGYNMTLTLFVVAWKDKKTQSIFYDIP